MKISLISFFIFLIYAGSASSQIINTVPLSVRQTSYRIDARLDPVAKTVSADMEAFLGKYVY